MRFWVENYRNTVSISLHYIKGTYYWHDLSLLIMILIGWLRLSTKVTLPLPLFHTIYTLRKEVFMHSPHLRSEIYVPHARGGVSVYLIWNYSSREICLSSLFIYLIFSLYQYGLVDIYVLGYNSIFCFCSSCFRFVHWDLLLSSSVFFDILLSI